MAIETKCTACGKTLRVGDEHAGKQARCPVCNTIFVVPPGSAGASATPPDTDRWSMQTPEGQIYGPVPKSDLDRWFAEGRIAHDCQLRCGDDDPWRPAGEFYGALATPRPAPAGTSADPFADLNSAAGLGTSPFSPATVAGTPTKSYAAPHRGALILILGILGWVFTCPLFGIAAWVLGSSDLREMREGRMDASGQGLTQAGQIMGVINTLLWLAIVVIGMFLLLLAFVTS
jgi:hypothetical protein